MRGHKLADAELAALQAQTQSILNKINQSSVEAQVAVRGSPNEAHVQEAVRTAIRLSTEAGQEFASLFHLTAMTPEVSAATVAARLRYREMVADETNADILDGEQRELRCAGIEAAAAEFNQAVCDEVYKKWGVGIGSRSGRLKGRKLPK
ncbi:hypothetical protein ACFODL_08935 [Phenylobacterium terrae]|uniref:Uncharacterized protein n=1 Tax=Phenylobacterium terrae TaxID=2665495 RepID=A0ABW4N4Q8_9CAUL